MSVKVWTDAEVRALARRFADGRQQIVSARGEYLRVLIETAQGALDSKDAPGDQRRAVKAAHDRFYPVVQAAIATDEIILAAGIVRKRVALERNRRLNFARSAYGTIRRWLRADGHDLMKLDAQKVTKSQLLNEAPPTRKHALTAKRVKARAGKLVGGVVGFIQQISKADQEQAAVVANEAIEQLIKLIARLGIEKKTTTDAHVATQEMRPLRVGKVVFWPTEQRIAK